MTYNELISFMESHTEDLFNMLKVVDHRLYTPIKYDKVTNDFYVLCTDDIFNYVSVFMFNDGLIVDGATLDKDIDCNCITNVVKEYKGHDRKEFSRILNVRFT